ncbi:Uma2 family endonuclease [Dactylosporangium aurantiacum]|uniref:Uma2 family endonuclease n=1 Tax=Dactylosporangium aurantiacum TaxID=35754 RepID=A0A9Q9MFS0_9ACTN|nr:Uma2 family endonuclease [Dactylosporangium aurantiacum]
MTRLPPGLAAHANLPGTAYSLVIEIVSEHAENGEYTDKALWYAQRGIPEYWIVDQTPTRADDDATSRCIASRCREASRPTCATVRCCCPTWRPSTESGRPASRRPSLGDVGRELRANLTPSRSRSHWPGRTRPDSYA